MLHLNLDGSPKLPEYDAEKHNPEKVFAFLTYRGLHYTKWVYLDPFHIRNWKINTGGLHPSFFYAILNETIKLWTEQNSN